MFGNVFFLHGQFISKKESVFNLIFYLEMCLVLWKFANESKVYEI